MGSQRQPGEMILKEISNTESLISRNPTVLSCGGIFIPRPGEERHLASHIITTSSRDEPVKIVTGVRPRNALYEVLLKESMN